MVQKIKYSARGLFKSLWKILANTVLYALALICGSFEVILFCIKQRFFGHRLPNYHVVEGSPLHRGGQPSNSGLKELSQRGIKTIINLRVGNFNRKVTEEYHADSLRIIHLPFYPYGPQDQIMIDFLKIICSRGGQPAFVHCFHGADRTGAVCAIYRIIVQNWDKESAIAEMKRKGLHFWHRNLIDYIRNIDTDYIRAQVNIT